MASPLTPEVIWAQRSHATDLNKNIVYITINVAQIKPDTWHCDFTSTTVSFGGTTTKDVHYKVDLELYDEIDPEESRKHFTTRGLDLVLRKKEAKVEFWPRLLKGTKKAHFVKTDFDKWVDEDEQDTRDDLDNLGGGGVGGMDFGGGGGLDFSQLAAQQGLDDIDSIPKDTEEDSDEDDEIPGLEDANESKGEHNAGIEVLPDAPEAKE